MNLGISFFNLTHLYREVKYKSNYAAPQRPQKEIFQEAADLAYYFHWPRTEIMEMTGKERGIWLEQIHRIHKSQKQQRDLESAEQLKIFMENRQQDML